MSLPAQTPLKTVLVLAWALSGGALAQTTYPVKLTQTPVRNLPIGGTGGFEISPDGSRVVYSADQDTIGVFELYSVPIGGGASTKLNGELVAGGIVISDFAISPDGSRVVYRADEDTDWVDELYSVPIGGGASTKLNDRLVAGGDVSSFSISPDSSRVVYLADEDTNDDFELYSVSIDGGSSKRLNGGLVTNGDVSSFSISPDSSRVMYRADEDLNYDFDLYSVPIDGGSSKKLTKDFFTWITGVGGGSFSPDSSRVIFSFSEEIGVSDIYSVPVKGGSAAKLNGALSGRLGVWSYRFSPDSSRVVFFIRSSVDELYSVPITGGDWTKLSDPFEVGGNVWNYAISPDGSRVVFSATFGLYSVPIEGGASTRLTGPWNVSHFLISPDGSRVVFRSQNRLYSVPIGGGAATKLSGPPVAGGEVSQSYLISADSSRVVYHADEDTDEVFELYSVPIRGGTSRKLSGALVAGGDVKDFQLAPRSGAVVFRADKEQNEVFDVFAGRTEAVWTSGGGDWNTGGHWQNGAVPDALMEAVIAVPAVVEITDSGTPTEAAFLEIGGAEGSSILKFTGGAVAEFLAGWKLNAGAVVRGDGSVHLGSQSFTLAAGAELRADAGETLTIQSGAVTNAGRIEALGVTSSRAELIFSGAVANSAGTGVVVAQDAILRFAQGVTNNGGMVFAGGMNELFGDLDNTGAGMVEVSGESVTVFHDDVMNGSVLTVSAAGGMQSTARFAGALSGNGVSGGGQVFIEGASRPGFSAGTMAFGGDVSYGPLATMEIELGVTIPGADYDRVTVAGHLELGGSLEVTLIGGFVPAAGMVFDVWDAGTVSGAFNSVSLPALPEGLSWHIDEVNTTGELRVRSDSGTYAEFANLHGLTTPAGGDEEGDGLANIFEYLTGRDPNTADFTGPWMAYERTGNDDILEMTIATPLGSDVMVNLETSTILMNGGSGEWTVIASKTGDGPWSGSASVVTTLADAGMETVTVSNTSTGAMRFYRLRMRVIP